MTQQFHPSTREKLMHWDMYKDVCGNIVYASERLEIIQMSVHSRMDKLWNTHIVNVYYKEMEKNELATWQCQWMVRMLSKRSKKEECIKYDCIQIKC